MAQYENYRGQGGQGGYGNSNPYDEDTSYGGGNPYSQGQYDRTGYEMSNMNASDPNRILNECSQIDATATELESRQSRLQQLQKRSLNEPNLKGAVDKESDEILDGYRKLVARTKRVKQDPESGNPRNAPQVGRVDRRVKASMNSFQQVETDHRHQVQAQMERDYRIVRPDASDAEVREAVQDPSQQIFSQALMNSDRSGQATSTVQNVRARHLAIQKIENDMIQLSKMFQDLDAIVIQQGAQVEAIEQKGNEVTDHVTKANIELDGAVTKARSARKKKWICLGISIAIIIVIIIIIVVAVLLTRGNRA